MARRSILFVTQCSERIGFGHVMRCLRLARVLRRRFRLQFYGAGLGAHAAVVDPFECTDRAGDPDCVVTDLLHPHALPGFESILRRRPIVSLHDMGLAQLDSDCAIDGSVLQMRPYRADRSPLYLGPRYMVIEPPPRRRSRPRSRIFLNFGGGSVATLHGKVTRALEEIAGDYEIAGCRGFLPWDHLRRFPKVKWVPRGGSVARELGGAAIGICAGGLSVYEMAAAGVPALVISHHRRQEVTAAEFERRGVVISLGNKRQVTVGAIRWGIETLLCAVDRRARMAQAGRQLVDGRGLARVSRIIARYAA